MAENKFAWEKGPFKLFQTPLAKYPHRKDDKYVNFATLMALIHNSWIRAFNAIYVAAPHVPPSEYKTFVGYAFQVYAAVKGHHDEEEEFVFPLIERMTGAEGLMKANVEQHHAFEVGLQRYESYLSGLIQTKSQASFSGVKLCELIDGFCEPLQIHLEDEISTLLNLDRFPDVDIQAMQKKAEDDTLAHMKLAQLRDNLPIVMLNHDATFENGIHGTFPPLPPGLGFVMRRVVTCYNWSWWKYAACDATQMPHKLPFGDP